VTDLAGVLPIDKPAGPTSHDAVAAVRRSLGIRQVGHTGTLDPFASGLLLVCVGPATRLAEYFAPLAKTYVATMRLGEATDTDDLTGTVVSSSDLSAVDPSRIDAVLQAQVGTVQQMPPAYSAKKVQGERMYTAARQGRTVERTPSTVVIHAIRLLSVDLPDVTFEVVCGTGTYVRAIARDAGEALGVGGHLRALRRTAIGPHGVDGAFPLDQLADAARVREAMLAPADALAHLPRVVVDAAGEAELRHGRAVAAGEGAAAEGPIALVSAAGALLAIGHRDGDLVRPRKVFA
jgi:tRNA pseudouridine55 synthase